MKCAGHPVVASVLDVVMAPLANLRARVVPRASGRILEIGGGTGLNLPYYAPSADLTVIEPDPYMARRARRRAGRLGLSVDILEESAESLPFDDASFDTIVATWVFCTIPDPARAAREVARVMRPGGTIRFAEHTVSARPTLAAVQGLLTPAWRQVAGGCHLDRDTLAVFRAAGLQVEVQPHPRGATSLSLVPTSIGVGRRIRPIEDEAASP